VDSTRTFHEGEVVSGADWSNIVRALEAESVTFEGVIFRGADLKGSVFRDVTFEGCDFTGADLEGVEFSDGSVLTGCDLTRAWAVDTEAPRCPPHRLHSRRGDAPRGRLGVCHFGRHPLGVRGRVLGELHRGRAEPLQGQRGLRRCPLRRQQVVYDGSSRLVLLVRRLDGGLDRGVGLRTGRPVQGEPGEYADRQDFDARIKNVLRPASRGAV